MQAKFNIQDIGKCSILVFVTVFNLIVFQLRIW